MLLNFSHGRKSLLQELKRRGCCSCSDSDNSNGDRT
jgi:hypothetical protein